MITYKLRIDLQSERELYSDIVFTTGDKNGYVLEFSFFDNGVRMNLTDCALTVKTRRADGAVVIDGGTTSDGAARYMVADNAYETAGEVAMEAALVRTDGSYVTTKVIYAQVREGFGESGLTSSDNEPILAQLTAQTLAIRGEVNELDRKKADMTTLETLKHQSIPQANAEGYPVTISGQLPGEKLTACRLWGSKSKNLIEYPYASQTSSHDGITFTVNADGSITLNGTATGYAYFSLTQKERTITDPTKYYTLSGVPSDRPSRISIQCPVDGDWLIDEGAGKTFRPTNKIGGILIQVDPNTVCDNVVLRPQLEEGETATSFEVNRGVGTLDSASGKYKTAVTVQSKNLLDTRNLSAVYGGVTLASDENGLISISGTKSGNNAMYMELTHQIHLKAGTTYTFSAKATGTIPTAGFSCVLWLPGGSPYKDFNIANQSSVTFTAEQDVIIGKSGIYTETDNITFNTSLSLQLEIGAETTEYEKYFTPSSAEAIFDSPLRDGEYIDFINKKRVSDTSETNISVSGELKTLAGEKNIVTADSAVNPSKMEVSYLQDVNRLDETAKEFEANFTKHLTLPTAHEEIFKSERARFNPLYANALKGTAEGSNITINDAVDGTPLSLTLYGRCAETLADSSAEKSPDNPADITGVGESGSVAVTVTAADGNAQTITIPLGKPLYGIKHPTTGKWLVRDEIRAGNGKVLYVQNVMPYVVSSTEQYITPISDSLMAIIPTGWLVPSFANYSEMNYAIISTHIKSTGTLNTGIQIGAQGDYIQQVKINIPTNYTGIASADSSDQKAGKLRAWFLDLNDSGKPFTMYFISRTPTETDITDTAAGQALLALIAQNGVTITNSEGAEMKAKYNRDINKAFEELEEKLTNAILSTGGNT